MKVMVLGMSQYSFQNDNGQEIKGTKVHYVELSTNNENDMVGVIPQTATMPYEYFNILNKQNVPGIYTAKLSISLRGRRPVLRVDSFDYISSIDFEKLSSGKI